MLWIVAPFGSFNNYDFGYDYDYAMIVKNWNGDHDRYDDGGDDGVMKIVSLSMYVLEWLQVEASMMKLVEWNRSITFDALPFALGLCRYLHSTTYPYTSVSQ
jgi:hypothetical protein